MSETEILVAKSRKQLWAALFLVCALGATALIAGDMSQRLFALAPLAIAVLVAALRGPARPASASEAAMKTILEDELRQHANQRAMRNGFMAMLLAQPVLAIIGSSAYQMATGTAVLGVATVLGSILYYDR